jgi:hypothetical protein
MLEPIHQVAFINYLQRLLVEGDFVATYKFALLNAIADICIERPLRLDLDSSNQDKIYYTEITEKFIELYWQHATPFDEVDGKAFILLQNAGAQAAIINQLYLLKQQGVTSLTQLKQHKDWQKLLNKALKVLKDGPLWRLQLLAGQLDCYYYPHDKSKDYIQLQPGVSFCFRRFHDLVVGLVRNSWIDKIRAYPRNQLVIGDKGNLSDFLFGTNRQSLLKARHVMHDIQQGSCFYCKKKIQTTGQVDHFIPWARYPNDLAHNFVLAHGNCNREKSAHLAAQSHRDAWYEQNIITHSSAISSELSQYFSADSRRSEAVASWAYQQGSQSNALLWLTGKTFVHYQGSSSIDTV